MLTVISLQFGIIPPITIEDPQHDPLRKTVTNQLSRCLRKSFALPAVREFALGKLRGLAEQILPDIGTFRSSKSTNSSTIKGSKIPRHFIWLLLAASRFALIGLLSLGVAVLFYWVSLTAVCWEFSSLTALETSINTASPIINSTAKNAPAGVSFISIKLSFSINFLTFGGFYTFIIYIYLLVKN